MEERSTPITIPPEQGGDRGVGEAVPPAEPSLPLNLEEVVEEVLDAIWEASPLDYEYFPCKLGVTARLHLKTLEVDVEDEEEVEERFLQELENYGFTPLSEKEIMEFEACLDPESLYFKLPSREQNPYVLLEISTGIVIDINAFMIFEVVRWD